jgi:hypothetical protein
MVLVFWVGKYNKIYFKHLLFINLRTLIGAAGYNGMNYLGGRKGSPLQAPASARGVYPAQAGGFPLRSLPQAFLQVESLAPSKYSMH